MALGIEGDERPRVRQGEVERKDPGLLEISKTPPPRPWLWTQYLGLIWALGEAKGRATAQDPKRWAPRPCGLLEEDLRAPGRAREGPGLFSWRRTGRGYAIGSTERGGGPKQSKPGLGKAAPRRSESTSTVLPFAHSWTVSELEFTETDLVQPLFREPTPPSHPTPEHTSGPVPPCLPLPTA